MNKTAFPHGEFECTPDDQIISNGDMVNNSEKMCMHPGFAQWTE